MGKIVTPTYRVEFFCNGRLQFTSSVWEVRSRGMTRGHGQPTEVNLQRYLVTRQADATAQGVELVGARIVRQADDRVVTELWLIGARVAFSGTADPTDHRAFVSVSADGRDTFEAVIAGRGPGGCYQLRWPRDHPQAEQPLGIPFFPFHFFVCEKS